MRAVIDTNVILDVLQDRKPWSESGKAIFLAVASKQVTGCITAKQASDIHFFSRKQFPGEKNTDEKARNILSKLFKLFVLIDSTAADCQNALGIPNNDYEDAMLIESARRSGADCIVTRNPGHFMASPVPVYSPEDFIKIIPPDSSVTFSSI